ncbi:MAG: sugar phosphate nucleotidyltransferase [bacterium]|nr:sugar phosphate nucleotidyltransferase [bacterium]
MSYSGKIKKAVIAAAGYGTRFLPATKVVPKEMLPIIDKPIIQYLAEEAAASGITEIIIVVRSTGSLIERHFAARDFDTAVALDERKRERLKSIEKIKNSAALTFVEQDPSLPYGNASPLISARRYLNDGEPFVYMFGDDLTLADKPVTGQLIEFYEKHKPDAILAVQEVSEEEVYRYGTVRYQEKSAIPYQIEMSVEKAPKGQAPSNMAQFGRFVFTGAVLDRAEKKETGKDGELWVTDILNSLAKEGKKVVALPIDGQWLTTGDPLRFIQTTLAFAAKDPELKEPVANFLKKVGFE